MGVGRIRALSAALCVLASVALIAAAVPDPAQAAEPPPIAAYSFDENEGTVAHDASGNGHEGTIEGPAWTTGKYGSALEFDAEAGDIVTIPDSEDLRFEDFTLEAWVRPSEEREKAPAIAKTSSSERGYMLYASGEAIGHPQGETTQHEWTEDYAYGAAKLPLNAWTHLVVTDDGSQIKLYVNGELVDSRSASEVKAGKGPLQIGGNESWASSEYFDGKIDEVRLYDRALSEGEVKADRKTPIEAAPSEGPIAAYSFDENEGTVAHDASGNGHEGTIEGPAWTTGKYGSALEFDAEAGDIVTIPDSEDLRFEDFTLEAWVRPSEEREKAPAIAKTSSSERGYMLYASGEAIGHPQGETTQHEWTEDYAYGAAKLPLNAWTHLVVTDDGSQIKLYVNGELVDSRSASEVKAGKGPLQIGGNESWASAEYFDGKIDEVRLYDRALSEGEAAQDEHLPVQLPEGSEGDAVAEGGSGKTSKCTNVWIGASTGMWQDAESWSAEASPTASDVACIPTGKSVEIASGERDAGVLQGRGKLLVSGGTLTVEDTVRASNIGKLEMTGGTIDGPGALHVVSSLVAVDGRIEGSGVTFIGTKALGRVKGEGSESEQALRISKKHAFVVRGALVVQGPGARLVAKEAAEIESEGPVTVEGEGGEIAIREKALLEIKGDLALAGKDDRLIAREAATVENAGSLTAAGAESFVALRSGAELTNSGTVALEGADAEMTIEDAALENLESLSATGADEALAIAEGGTLENAGTLVMSGARAGLYVEDAEIDNAGTLSVADLEGQVWTDDGARVENSGTLVFNGEEEAGIQAGSTGSAPVIANTGTVAKRAGVGETSIGVRLNNEGVVETRSGRLRLSETSHSGQEHLDSWIAREPEGEGESAIALDGASFALGDTAELIGTIELEGGASVKAGQLEAEDSSAIVGEGSLQLTDDSGESSLGGLTLLPGGVATTDGVVSAIAARVFGGELVVPRETKATIQLLEQVGGLATVGDSADLTIAASILGGTLQLGEDVEAHLPYFFQFEGSTTVGGQANLDIGSVFLVDGTFDVAADSDLTFEGSLFQDGGFVQLGDSTTLSASALYLEDEGLDVGEASSLELGALYVEGTTFRLGSASILDIAGSAYVYSEGVLELGASGDVHIGDIFEAAGTETIGAGGDLEAGKLFVPEGELNVENGSSLELEKAFVYGAGTVDLSAATEMSGDFVVVSGGAVEGAGDIRAEKLIFEDGLMEGSGSATIEEEGVVAGDKESTPVLSERTLVNNGDTELADGRFMLTDGAEFRNQGVFSANSETPGEGGQMLGGPGLSSSRLLNLGAVEKNKGTGTTAVGVDFENFGTIEQKTGTLQIGGPVTLAASENFGGNCNGLDPVDCATGNFHESQTDFAIGGLGVGLFMTRSYSAELASAAASPGAFGYGWTGSFSDHLEVAEGGARVTLHGADGSTARFVGTGGTAYAAPVWSQDILTGSPEAGYTLLRPGQTELDFSGAGKLESVSDPNGNETTLAYDEGGRLEAIMDPAGREITLAYNEAGFIESAEDPMGHVTEYAYEGEDLKSVTLPGAIAPRWQFEYDGSHRITTVVDGRGGETQNEYDGSGRVISQADPGGHTSSLEYSAFHTRITNEATGTVTDEWFNSYNQPFSVTNGYGAPEASTRAFDYNTEGRLASVTDGNGHTTHYGYDPAGNRTSEKDAAGRITKWVYDENHRVVSATTPGGETMTIDRDPAGNPESISRPGPEETTQTTSFAYDGDGLLESVTDPLERTWTYGYDPQGNRTAAVDPLGNTTRVEYDGDSRPVAIVNPRGNAEGAEASEFTTAIQRDARGRPEEILDPLGNATKYVYDGNGNLETRTDANGHATTYTYSPDNEPIKVERPNGATFKTAYDGAGQMIGQTDGNEHTTTYVRDALGRLVETTDPLGRKTIASYDPAGNLEAVVDPAERETSYSYDVTDRLEAIDYSDPSTSDVGLEYDLDGNLVEMADGSGESSFEYDELGRLVEQESGHGDVVGYEYDLADELTAIAYPNGKEVQRKYDPAGRLEKVVDWLGGTTSFAYDPASNLESITFPSASGNIDSYGYDRTGRMDEAAFGRGAETLASLSYAREDIGQVEGEAIAGLPGPEEISYGYDENDRLTSAGPASFEYDPADNLTKAPGTSNEYDPASQLEAGTGVSYSYDQLGQRTKSTATVGPATSYEYDQAGNLTAIERPEKGEVPTIDEAFTYNGGGLLAARNDGLATEHLSWDNSAGLPLLLSDEKFSYVYGPGGLPIEQISAEEEVGYLHHDQLGSTRMLTDATGETSASFTYETYGAIASHIGSASTRLGFAGQYTDPDSDLQYLRARFYDPETGQFLTRDPLVAITGQPYAYAFDNPINRVDPSGQFGEAVAVGCGIGEVVEPVGGCAPGALLGAAAEGLVVGTAAAASVGAAILTSDEEIFGGLTMSPGLEVSLARSQSDEEALCTPSEMPNFDDTTQPPGPDWEWKGNGPQGSKEGSYVNGEERLRPHLDSDEHGPHYDFQSGRKGPRSRIYPDGRIELK